MSVHNDALFENEDFSKIEDAKILIVYTEWNDFIVNELVSGCEKTLKRKGIAASAIEKVSVPGSIEIPFACKRYFEAASGKGTAPDAIIAFGCVIRGETPHFDYVCQAVTEGITHLNLSLPVPVIYGILTVNDIKQAKDRIGGNHGHKGDEAALTALKMVRMNRSLSSK